MGKGNGNFLNASDIRTLLNENIDENASHFIFLTTHGTILGHSTPLPSPLARKIGAFAGTTWLRHSACIAETGSASSAPDIGLNGRTLKVVIGEEGKGVHGMVVAVDGLVGAVRGVREGCLMAALLERGRFGGEVEGGMGLDGGKEGEGKGEGKGEAEAEEAEGQGQGKGESSGFDERGENSDDLEENSDDGTSSQTSELEDAPDESKSLEEGKLSKIRILEIRAEAMAKEFAEEICGPDFTMPDDFY